MEDMEKLVIQTRNSLYEIIIIDGRSGEILVRGGQFFPELTPARLAGATLAAASAKCAEFTQASEWKSTPVASGL